MLVRPAHHAVFVPLAGAVAAVAAPSDARGRARARRRRSSSRRGPLRNYAHDGRFVLVASDGGVTFWTGNHPLAIGEGDLAANPAAQARQPGAASRASRTDRRTDGADLLPRGARLDARASGRLARARSAQGVLSRRADWPVVPRCTRRATSSRRSCRTGCCCRWRSPARGGSARAAPAAAGPVAARWRSAVVDLSGVLSAGALPDSRASIPRSIVCAARACAATGREAARRMTLLVVLPTYNERPNLERVAAGDPAPRLHAAARRRRRLAGRHGRARRRAGGAVEPGRIEVMHRTGPRGLGLAYVDGLRRALATDADAIGQMDADLSHDPKYLPDLAGRARALRPRDRIALPARRQRRELAAAPHHAERVRESLHPGRHRALRRTTARAGTACGGARRWRRLPLDRRAANGYAFLTEMLYEAARARLPHRRSADRLRRARRRATRRSRGNVLARIAADAVAARSCAAAACGDRRPDLMAMRHVVVMVATSYPRFPGDGVGSFMEPIAKGVAARGHEVHLVAPWHPAITRGQVEDGVYFHFFHYAPVPSLNVFGYAVGAARGHATCERGLGRGAARARRRLVQGVARGRRSSAPPSCTATG